MENEREMAEDVDVAGITWWNEREVVDGKSRESHGRWKIAGITWNAENRGNHMECGYAREMAEDDVDMAGRIEWK